MISNHPLIRSLLDLRGNSRACVYTEPLWGIPFNLYAPFVSVYMAALMMTDRQIGLIASVFMFFRAPAALLGGAVTDKLGRRRTTLIFDLLAWSIPCLLWAFSQNFWWFAAAAACNGLMQVSDNSWICLLVEDSDKGRLVGIFSLIHLSGQLAVIFAPLSALLVGRLSVIPAMRILYIFSFCSMTAKFVLLYRFCGETKTGETRMRDTAGQSLLAVMSGYGRIFKAVFASPGMALALVISTLFFITQQVWGSFFGLYVTGNLTVPERYLAFFHILRALIIALFMFVIQPRLERLKFRLPMLAGILCYWAGYAALLSAPIGRPVLPVACVILDACAYSMVIPRGDSLTALLIEPNERARIRSVMMVITLGCGIPFGYLAGWLSETDRRLPFILNAAVFAIAFAVIALNKRLLAAPQGAEEEPNA